MSWTLEQNLGEKKNVNELQIRCWRYHLRLFTDFKCKNRTSLLKYFLLFSLECFDLKKKIVSSFIHPIPRMLYLYFAAERKEKKNVYGYIVVKLTNVSPFRWWFRTEFFDRSIYTLLFTKMEDEWRNISQVKRDFSLFKILFQTNLC